MANLIATTIIVVEVATVTMADVDEDLYVQATYVVLIVASLLVDSCSDAEIARGMAVSIYNHSCKGRTVRGEILEASPIAVAVENAKMADTIEVGEEEATTYEIDLVSLARIDVDAVAENVALVEVALTEILAAMVVKVLDLIGFLLIVEADDAYDGVVKVEHKILVVKTLDILPLVKDDLQSCGVYVVDVACSEATSYVVYLY